MTSAAVVPATTVVSTATVTSAAMVSTTVTVASTVASVVPSAAVRAVTATVAMAAVAASISVAVPTTEAVIIPASVSVPAAPIVAVAVTVAPTVVAPAVVSATVVTASVVARPIAPIIGAVPGAGTDEHPAYKIVGPVVAIRRTGVRIIAIIAIKAGGRRAEIVLVIVITRSNLNADRNLRLGQRTGNKENSKYCTVFQDSHNTPVSPGRLA
jgi:hypothetical protein